MHYDILVEVDSRFFSQDVADVEDRLNRSMESFGCSERVGIRGCFTMSMTATRELNEKELDYIRSATELTTARFNSKVVSITKISAEAQEGEVAMPPNELESFVPLSSSSPAVSDAISLVKQ